jgi:hypothetical protein
LNCCSFSTRFPRWSRTKYITFNDCSIVKASNISSLLTFSSPTGGYIRLKSYSKRSTVTALEYVDSLANSSDFILTLRSYTFFFINEVRPVVSMSMSIMPVSGSVADFRVAKFIRSIASCASSPET